MKYKSSHWLPVISHKIWTPLRHYSL